MWGDERYEKATALGAQLIDEIEAKQPGIWRVIESGGLDSGVPFLRLWCEHAERLAARHDRK